MQNDDNHARIDNTTDQKRLDTPAPSDQPNCIPTQSICADDQNAKVERFGARVKIDKNPGEMEADSEKSSDREDQVRDLSSVQVARQRIDPNSHGNEKQGHKISDS